jgi:chromosomal replication initiator protein DnaA
MDSEYDNRIARPVVCKVRDRIAQANHIGRSRMTEEATGVQQPTNDRPIDDRPIGLGNTNEASWHNAGDRQRQSTAHQAPIHDIHGRKDAPSHGGAILRIDQRVHLPESELNDATSVCDQIREHLTNSQGHNRVRRYLSNTVSIEHPHTNTIDIVAGDRFTLEMIERQLGSPLRIAAQFAMGTTKPKINYRVDPARHAAASNTDAPAGRDAHSAKKSQRTSPSTPNPLANRIPSPRSAQRFPACPSLNDFIVGSSNRLAFESIKQVIQSGTDCPPVFVHGSCGVGKTHLLRGATQYARKLHQGCKVRYTTGESFTNGFVTAIRTRSIETFQKKYRGLDLLCIDDIHLMAGKQATQHELLQIFNKLSLSGCKILLASDAHPREIGRLDQALASRFAAGLVVKVEDPDPEIARRLVTQIATSRGIFLEQPAIQTIVDRVGIGQGASVRDLEGAVLQIQAVARLMDQSNSTRSSSQSAVSPSMNHVRKALSLRNGSDDSVSSGPIALDTIISRICQEMTVSKSDLSGKGRQKKVVMARELIVHTARDLTSKSFPEIAYAIGRPNHSTVITAAKRFKERVSESQPIAVGCPHDGMPAGELAQMMATRVHQRN